MKYALALIALTQAATLQHDIQELDQCAPEDYINVKISADDEHVLYFDSDQVNNGKGWSFIRDVAVEVDDVCHQHMFAVRGVNTGGSPQRFNVQIDNVHTLASDWVCKGFPEIDHVWNEVDEDGNVTDWTAPDFEEDSTWTPAKEQIYTGEESWFKRFKEQNKDEEGNGIAITDIGESFWHDEQD